MILHRVPPDIKGENLGYLIPFFITKALHQPQRRQCRYLRCRPPPDLLFHLSSGSMKRIQKRRIPSEFNSAASCKSAYAKDSKKYFNNRAIEIERRLVGRQSLIFLNEPRSCLPEKEHTAMRKSRGMARFSANRDGLLLL